jgi:hypothetical protein
MPQQGLTPDLEGSVTVARPRRGLTGFQGRGYLPVIGRLLRVNVGIEYKGPHEPIFGASLRDGRARQTREAPMRFPTGGEAGFGSYQSLYRLVSHRRWCRLVPRLCQDDGRNIKLAPRLRRSTTTDMGQTAVP